MSRSIVYKRIDVLKLSTYAALVFGKALTNTLESIYQKENETEAVEQIRQHLIDVGTTTPAYYYLLEAISTFKSPAYALAVELLFNRNIKKFRVKNCARLAMTLVSKAATLESLDLQYLNLPQSLWYIYVHLLNNCKNLKEIKLPGIPGNDFWLPLLNPNCTKLRSLCTSNIIGLSGLVLATFRHTLTSIQLTKRNFSNDAYFREMSTIVMFCSNLKLISPSINLCGIIQKCRDVNNDFTCSFESLIIDESNESLLSLIKSACPKLLQLKLQAPSDGSLHVLSNIPLQLLEISDYEYKDLLQLIKNIGENLIHLRLGAAKEMATFVNVTELVEYCPKLTTLKLNDIIVVYPDMDLNFTLKKIHVMDCLYSDMEFLNFLSVLQNLEDFYADEVSFTDDDIERYFCRPNFNTFKKFFVRKAENLTIRTIHALLHFCPNLVFVGQLLAWKLDFDDANLIQFLIATSKRVSWIVRFQ